MVERLIKSSRVHGYHGTCHLREDSNEALSELVRPYYMNYTWPTKMIHNLTMWQVCDKLISRGIKFPEKLTLSILRLQC
ncbi:BAF_HP2_G0030180.mRNA.1.CDS.1 [Saccharomyces cerevisiae]|nr:BAF_HP2_G0030180.mRNA.1.CDS.1 [Saccharomyces cerevisiae]CAI6455311.1 BAF_HP2_G0030180.mRNA.1.CDS.1 [Saccharomyces cerevisiae]